MARAKTSPKPAPIAAQDTVDASKDSAAPELFKARVLATGAFGVVDTVVQVDATLLRQGVACGQLDPNPEAVAYAESTFP
jgi:hypothetical protein